MDVLDMWRTVAIAGAMFSAGLSGIAMLTVYQTAEWRLIALAYQWLMAMAAIEQGARIGHDSPLTWRLPTLSLIVVVVIPAQIRVMRTGKQPIRDH